MKATEQQIPKLTGQLVEHQKAFASLSSEDAQWVIANTVAAIGLFVTAVKNRAQQEIEKAVEVVKRTLTPWKKAIKIGGVSKKDLAKKLKKYEVGNEAQYIMGKDEFVIVTESGSVDFVTLTPSDLGFTSCPRTDAFMTKEFCAAWSAKYLEGYVIELCQPEDGPQLRHQYDDQPKGETVWMAMERITGSDGYPHVFYVGCDGGGTLWLNAPWVSPDDAWGLDGRVVFRLRKLPLPSAAA